MSETRIIQRLLPTGTAAPKPGTVLLSPGAAVGEYVPYRKGSSEALAPSMIFGQTVETLEDVPTQAVYTRAQIDILREQGYTVVIAEESDRRAQADLQKDTDAASMPAGDPALRAQAMEAYNRAANSYQSYRAR